MKIHSETMKKGNKSVIVKPNLKKGTTFEFFTGKEFDLSKTFHTLLHQLIPICLCLGI